MQNRVFSISYLEFVFECLAVFLILLVKFPHIALSLDDELVAGVHFANSTSNVHERPAGTSSTSATSKIRPPQRQQQTSRHEQQ